MASFHADIPARPELLRLVVFFNDIKFRTTIPADRTVHSLIVLLERDYSSLMVGNEPLVCLRLKDADGCLLPGTLRVGDVLHDGSEVFVVHDRGPCAIGDATRVGLQHSAHLSTHRLVVCPASFSAAKAAAGKEWSLSRVLAQWESWQVRYSAV